MIPSFSFGNTFFISYAGKTSFPDDLSLREIEVFFDENLAQVKTFLQEPRSLQGEYEVIQYPRLGIPRQVLCGDKERGSSLYFCDHIVTVTKKIFIRALFFNKSHSNPMEEKVKTFQLEFPEVSSVRGATYEIQILRKEDDELSIGLRQVESQKFEETMLLANCGQRIFYSSKK